MASERAIHLIAPAALTAYGIWRIAALTHNVDVSGYHFRCSNSLSTLFAGGQPTDLNLVDTDAATTVSSEQVNDWALWACKRDADESLTMNLLWLVPVAYWLVLNASRWFIRDVDGGWAKARRPTPARLFAPTLVMGLVLAIGGGKGMTHLTARPHAALALLTGLGLLLTCVGGFWSAYAWAYRSERPPPPPPEPPAPVKRDPDQARGSAL